MTVRNNIASGSWHHGFHFIPLECGAGTGANQVTVFRDNVAHSISGYGAIAANRDGNPECIEVIDFSAYKCTESSIMLGGAS